MAHSLSAKKRIRQNLKRRLRNQMRKSMLKTEIKKYLAMIKEKAVENAEEQLKKIYKKLDQVAAKGTIHKNKASRLKSRLTRKLIGLKKQLTDQTAG